MMQSSEINTGRTEPSGDLIAGHFSYNGTKQQLGDCPAPQSKAGLLVQGVGSTRIGVTTHHATGNPRYAHSFFILVTPD